MAGGFEFGGDAAPDGAGSSDERAPSDAVESSSGRDSIEFEDGSAAPDPELAELLYAGERVEATLDVDGGRLVRTSHRLLVHTPDADGRTLAVVQRPNVEGLSAATSGRAGFVSPALKAILVGVILVGAGATVPVDGMASTAPSAGGAGATGMGGTVALLGQLLSWLSVLDDLLRLLGALVMLVGVALLGLYLRSRRREVVVSVAGDEDLRLPAADVTAEDVARLAPDR